MYAAASIISVVFLLAAMYFEHRDNENKKQGGYTKLPANKV
jgi:hypothetical protein